MPNIKILPPDIISKIAAGEVVERPASVVKELIENAIDAGADNISIELKDSGKTEILIRDNGSGIAKDDLENMFQRHATSKLRNLDDLYNIHSLGFRGEALYSIGAIADVTLQTKTKTKTSDSGWDIHIRGGIRQDLKPCPFSGHGTAISVKELFFNTPARRKFLKGDTTELNQIIGTVLPYTLLHTHIHFTLKHNEKTLLSAESSDNRVERVAHVLKLDSRHLIETKENFSSQLPQPPLNLKRGLKQPELNSPPSLYKEGVGGSYSLHLILGDINLRRPRRDMQYLFVNGRPVQNKNLSFALAQAYRLVLPPDEHPVFVAMIDLPPEDVDANVHPAKREVKIKDEQKLFGQIRHLCERTLMTSSAPKQASLPGGLNSPQSPRLSPRGDSLSSFGGLRGAANSFRTDNPPSFLEEGNKGSSFDPIISEPTPSYGKAGSSTGYSYPSMSPKEFQEQLFDSPVSSASSASLQKKLAGARVIGIFRAKYVLLECGDSLLVMDQHAAAERINYERLIIQMEKGSVDIQHLLSPVTLRLTASDMLTWEESKDALNELGFATDLWKDDAIAVHSHPRVIKDIEHTVRDILAGGKLAKRDHDILARRACRCSIMTGDRLSGNEAEALRADLIKCLDPLTCPHGRPTVVEMTEGFLDKQFLRT